MTQMLPMTADRSNTSKAARLLNLEGKTYRQIIAELAAHAGKSDVGAPGYSRWVNRPLGRRVAAFAAMRGMTPDQLTALNALIIFPILLLLPVFRPTPPWSVLVAILLMVGYVLDSADGQLARLRGGGTKAGEWFDHVSDAVKTALVHAALTVTWFRFYEFDSPAWMLVPVAFGVVASAYFFSLMLADDLRRLAKVERGLEVAHTAPTMIAGRTRVLRSFLVLPADWGVICMTLALLPAQYPFVFTYTLLLGANLLLLIAGWVRWYRELVTL